MFSKLQCLAWTVAVLSAAPPLFAQDSNLASGGAELIWNGTSARAHAGTWLDQGAVSNADARRDLIVGAPGAADVAGKVYIVFGGPVRTGTAALSSADTVISSTEAGNGFGTATASANVLNLEGTVPRAIVVGAPGALGGRGAVYVFAGGLVNGSTRAVADAVFTITGAPGDRLGSALALGDLDADGYRDLIIGAPGNGRVYVIYGGPMLSGTRDLATTAADVRIVGTGIGSILAAGDVTGDGIYDMLIGAPSVNLVYLINGHTTRAIPANMAVQRDEDAYFLGFPDTQAGASIRLGDVDADGKTDIIIGAPNAGPAGEGAIYVLWGGVNFTPIGLGSANVAFTGPYTNAHLGRVVTSGDINRDSPDDLAMLVSASGPSAPETVLIYYGRRRSEFGVAAATGRVVDLSNPANIGRRIIGNVVSGSMTSMLVYEVTGEGARDLIIGTPGASSTAGAESGLVYFANSPRMSLTPTRLRISAAAGASSSASATVGNSSAVMITWTATPKAPWISLSGATGMSSAAGSGSVGVTAATAGLAPGVYSGSVDITSTSKHLQMTQSLTVELTVISQPTLSTNVPLPANFGQAITWTAQASAPGATLLYAFFRLDGTTWTRVQDFSTSNTYTWTPTLSNVGQHSLQVWVKTSTSTTATLDTWAGQAFVITKPVTKLTSFVQDGLYPMAPNTPVHFTATAIGGSGPVEYRFVILREGTGWSVLQEYSSANTVTWTPTLTGNYGVQVWVRSVGVTDLYEDWRGTDMMLVTNTLPVNVISLTSDKPMPVTAGASVTFTAAATGGANGPLQYQFVQLDERTGWRIARPYGASRTYTWTTGPNDTGRHVVQVWVKTPASTATFEAWSTTGFFDVVMPPLSTPAIKANVAFPVPAGTPITWIVTAAGGIAPLQYRFVRLNQATGVWSVAQEYSGNNSYSWTPTAAENGTYLIQVWVKSSGSTALYDTWNSTGFFKIDGSSPAAIASFMADRPLPAAPGTTITWTAVPTGGTAGPHQFRFVRLNQATGVWSVAQEYSASNSYTWNTAAGDAGTHLIQVWIKSAGSPSLFEGWATTSFFKIGGSPASIASFTADRTLPAPAGSSITWTATAAGGTAGPLQYRFVRFNQMTGVWSVAREYSASNTHTWNTTAADRGTYVIQVWVRSAGSTAQFEGWSTTGFFTLQ